MVGRWWLVLGALNPFTKGDGVGSGECCGSVAAEVVKVRSTERSPDRGLGIKLKSWLREASSCAGQAVVAHSWRVPARARSGARSDRVDPVGAAQRGPEREEECVSLCVCQCTLGGCSQRGSFEMQCQLSGSG